MTSAKLCGDHTPQQRAAHDQWSRAYLVAVLRRDTQALDLLTEVDPCRRSAWDRLDAVAATARDVIAAFIPPAAAIEHLQGELLEAATAE